MVCIILVNWNGWRDTLECLESIFRMDHLDFTVVVCDNASEDNSVAQIQSWCDGGIKAEASGPAYAGALGDGVPKPIAWQIWRGERDQSDDRARVVLIPLNANRGFAGGCNAGIRFALLQPNVGHVWLLNNDTVVDRLALTRLIEKMNRRPDVGMCGATLRYYFEPERVQCRGGYGFNPWTGRVQTVALWNETAPEEEVEQSLKYVSGASMFVRRSFLERVGLMNEQYFLYFEEIDWASRGQHAFNLGYCRDAIVYHKEGSSIGSNRLRRKRSLFSESYLSRNRVLFMRTYYPCRLPITMLWITSASLLQMATGQFRSGWVKLRSAWSAFVRNPASLPPRS